MKTLATPFLMQAQVTLNDKDYVDVIEEIVSRLEAIVGNFRIERESINMDRNLSGSGKEMKINEARIKAAATIKTIKTNEEEELRLERRYLHPHVPAIVPGQDGLLQFLQEQEIRNILLDLKPDGMRMRLLLEDALNADDDRFIDAVANGPIFARQVDQATLEDVLKRRAWKRMPQDIKEHYEDIKHMNSWIDGLKHLGLDLIGYDIRHELVQDSIILQ